MRGRMRVPLFVVALALLGLIGLLATLQFHWLGQISDAERDRMRATLETGASAFARDFDSELTRAYLLFQIDPLGRRRGSADRFCRALRPLARDVEVPASHQALLSLHVGRDDPPAEVRSCRRGRLAAVDWPASMQDWRDHVIDTVTEPASSRGGDYLHPPDRIADLGVGAGDRRALTVAAGREPAAGNRHAFGAARRLHDSRNRRELRVARDAAGARRAALHAEQRRRCAVGGGQPRRGAE